MNKDYANGYVTFGSFASSSGFIYYLTRKLLNQWTLGENPKLLISSLEEGTVMAPSSLLYKQKLLNGTFIHLFETIIHLVQKGTT